MIGKSEKTHAVLDDSSRVIKANKISSVLNEFVDLKMCKVLDIGIGSGRIIQQISQLCYSATGVDLCDERTTKSGYSFQIISDEHLPYNDNYFDVVISNHVIEHVRNQELHISEAYRVLKGGGVFYLAMPNKYGFFDPHYKLPLISWLPRSFSSAYLRATRGKDWDIYPISLRSIKRITSGNFYFKDMTIDVMMNPDKYHLDSMKSFQPLVRILPSCILKCLNLFAPTHILVLRKI